MRVFVTGASGWVGSAVVADLIAAGHSVLGLARSDANAETIAAAGADVHRGALEDLDSLQRGAAETDGVIHCAFIHDFANMAESCAVDKRAIEAMGDTLAGCGRPLVAASGVALLAPGRVSTEETVRTPDAHALPRVSEEAALATETLGVKGMAVRLPPTVHGAGDHGFVPILIGIAREKGVAAYVGEGLNRWPATHRLDAARVFRLALEKGVSGKRYHAIAEEGVPFKEIAAVIGKRLGLPVVSVPPEKAAEHFGWFAMFAGVDTPSSSALTREWLEWSPTGPGLIEDLDQHYFGG
ncbi:nucleoside-diphosphate-sugar epimerase [Roseiarcus fermentans]|uniref:Nucleoside-diphosphate-sugar epimerase n=1 Tax=Roseiarcus fermentans TaxID=1473586 RepID=A0A366FCJ4_9HYPH|nr:SDR family oxidoreductase [Roseiarcus fermentans]RBP12307.1 nucleoside-diphosphate-sugar epimerase [Roseiarcus fermentans]